MVTVIWMSPVKVTIHHLPRCEVVNFGRVYLATLCRPYMAMGYDYDCATGLLVFSNAFRLEDKLSSMGILNIHELDSYCA